MNIDEIIKYCLDNFQYLNLIESFKEKSLFYNPNNKLKRGIYILTIKDKNGPNDKVSNLDRENIFRVNIGIRKETFKKLFNEIPKRPSKGGIVNMPYDFTLLNTILPHPIYAWMYWICILNPSNEMFERSKPLINESYEYAQEKFSKKKL